MDLDECDGRHAREGIVGLREEGNEGGNGLGLRGVPQGAGRLEGIVRLVEQRAERGHGSRVPRATEDVDGRERPEEALALYCRDEQIDGGVASDPADRLDGCKGHVVVRVLHERGQPPHRDRGPAPPQDLDPVAHDRRIGRVRQSQYRLVHARVASHERLGRRREARLLVATGEQ